MNTKKYRLLLPVCAAALMSISMPERSSGQETSEKKTESTTEFIRLTKQGEDLQALQTAIVRYALENDSSKKSGKVAETTVDLIGAVHIGEASYYKTLNDLFTDYDVVLYELVAPEGTRVPKGGGDRKSSNPISFMQVSAQRFLGLESQLQLVDYTQDNFKHADLSPADMAEKMKERGESTMSLMMGAFSEMMNDTELKKRLNADNASFSLRDITDMMSNPLKAKRFMARQMGAMGNIESGLGSKLTQLIVDDRNEAAMKVLDEVLEDGEQKKIAIFYGAAHMADFEERLAERKFQLTSQSWLTAWDLTQSHSKAKNESPMSLLMQLMKDLDN